MLKKSTVLLVDDEEELVENLAFDLREDVDEFLTAYNGKDALKVFKENKKDITCIITDIKMPQMNGLQFIQEVRGISSSVPVIFLTAHGDEEQMKLALSLNAFDFSNKPYDLWELKEMLVAIHDCPSVKRKVAV